MKKFFFSVAALAAAMTFTACSSEDIISQDSMQNAAWNEDGTGYMTLSVQLPQINTTRGLNDQFDDGLENEYAVNDLVLIIFGGDKDNEAEATFASAYSISKDELTENPIGTTTDNITSEHTFATQITRMGGTYAYAMVALNTNGIFTVDGTALKVNGANFTGTVEDLQKMVVSGLEKNANKLYTNGFLMMNAPLWKTAGTDNAASVTKTEDGKVVLDQANNGLTYLSRIDRTRIYGTKDEAKAGAPATAVNVERAVAKVTMHENQKGTQIIPEEGPKLDLAWEVKGWLLDNTNKSSYLLRNMTNYTQEGGHESGWDTWVKYYSPGAETDKYRFVGKDAVKCSSMNNNLYRTYFAIDPNYTSYSADNFHRTVAPNGDLIGGNVFKETFGNTNPSYCAENTFNLANQIWGATTRIVLKVQLGNGDDFWTTEENGATAFYTQAQVGTVAASNFIALHKSNLESSEYISYMKGNPVNVAFDGDKTFTVSWNIGTDKEANNTIVFATAEEIAKKRNAGLWNTQSGNYNGFTGVEDFSKDGWQQIRDKNNELLTDKPSWWVVPGDVTPWTSAANGLPTDASMSVYKFEKGVAYYETRIQHFGDEGCPWKTNKSWENPQPSVSVGAYPASTALFGELTSNQTAEAKYLGRWGVLRNNWYDLNVTGIRKIGSPTPPALEKNESNTDDELEQFIKVDVNILAWAKRTQEVNL